jgi:hypothetical protein
MAPSNTGLWLHPLEGGALRYAPGQYVVLEDREHRIPQRAYSIANAPRPDGLLSLLVTRVHDGQTSTKIETARLLVYKSAVLLDQGQPNTLVSSHAKRFAADSAMEITVDAVQVYGGYGFIRDYPVEKLMR